MANLIGKPKIQTLAKLKHWGLKPLVLDFYLQHMWPTFSVERVFARVLKKANLSANVVSVHLKPNFNFKNFKAGQHVLLTVAVNGQRLTRTYSPTLINSKSLELTIKNIADGKVSSQIFNLLKPGAVVEISQPFGEMTWASLPASNHYTFCAAGVGITPLRSLIREWSHADLLRQSKKIELHYWAATEADLCFKEELQQIESQTPSIKIYFYTTRVDKGIFSNVKINESLFLNEKTVFVACGPKNFVNTTEKIALKTQQKFYGEHAQNVESADLAESSQVSFFEIDYDGQTIQASSNKTILESLEENGFSPVHGCRMGICKSCTCLKTSGVAISLKDKSVSEEPNEEIQICVSKPRSKMIIKGY